ncbi:putative catechol O-methyltransferase [Fusarium fujikuroi]|nr:putative catechol O-methyltransferase [Fusarium fujikuroi]
MISKLYKPEEEVCVSIPTRLNYTFLRKTTQYGDGREQQLLDFVKSHPRLNLMENNPSEVLSAIDEFGHQENFLMNVGKNKGAIVTNIIAERSPALMVELGGYIGYSAILFGDALKKAGGQKYISLEINETFASVASSLISIAGLNDIVEVRVGPCVASLQRIREENLNLQIDLLFLDHQKSAYVADLMLCEELSLIRSGSIVVADNVISPGAPFYLDYIRGSQQEKEQLRGQLAKEDERLLRIGNCSLKYTSRLHKGFEPTGEPDGIEESVCA